jgi:hypothetical protein
LPQQGKISRFKAVRGFDLTIRRQSARAAGDRSGGGDGGTGGGSNLARQTSPARASRLLRGIPQPPKMAKTSCVAKRKPAPVGRSAAAFFETRPPSCVVAFLSRSLVVISVTGPSFGAGVACPVLDAGERVRV